MFPTRGQGGVWASIDVHDTRSYKCQPHSLLVRTPEGAGNLAERVSKGHATNSCGSPVICTTELLNQSIFRFEVKVESPLLTSEPDSEH
jgi:hypothetical protein